MSHASRVTIAALLLALGATEGRAQPADDGRDLHLIEGFEQQVEAHRRALGIPGMSTVVIRDGEVLSARGFGYADLERRVPATADTLYHLASVTKTFTAVLVHRLVEQGKLGLDEPVARYSPEFKDNGAQVRHVLSHTSENTPGDAFNYSPDRFEGLKDILEKKYGKPLRQIYVEAFLEPLAMRDSVPSHDVADDDTTHAALGLDNLARYRRNLAHFAKPYTYWAEGNGTSEYAGYPPRELWVSAGLLSTVLDMARYDKAIDDHTLLKAETLAHAWTPVLSNAGKPLPFGLGWFVTDYRGERLVWHYGHWGTGFSSLYLKVPARRLTLVALANSEHLADHPYKLGDGDVTNSLFACSFLASFVPGISNAARGAAPPANLEALLADKQARNAFAKSAEDPGCELTSRIAYANWRDLRREEAAKRKPIPYDAALAAEYAGTYRLPHRDIHVTNEGGRLFINVPADGGHTEMYAMSPTEFFIRIRPWDLRFVKEGGKVVRLDFVEGDVTDSAPRVE